MTWVVGYLTENQSSIIMTWYIVYIKEPFTYDITYYPPDTEPIRYGISQYLPDKEPVRYDISYYLPDKEPVRNDIS